MSPLRFACLILAMVVFLVRADECFARNVRSGTAATAVVLSDAGSDDTVTDADAKTELGNSEIIGTTGGEFSSVGFSSAAVNADEQTSVLRGAGCGTIAPMDPVQGAGSYRSPMIPTPEAARPRTRQLPPIPTLLFFTITITASAWGLRDMAKRRRITIINAGVVAASVVTATGFTWSLFQPEEIGFGHFSQAGDASEFFASTHY